MPAVTAFNLQPGNNQAGLLAISLNGQAGEVYVLESSTDLVNWASVSTNTLVGNSFPYLIATTNAAKMFFRGLLSSP